MLSRQTSNQSQILVRRLNSEDEPFLWTALYYAIHVPPGQQAPAPEIVHDPLLARYVADWMRLPDDLGFAAEQDGDPIGAAWVRRWSDDVQGFGFVNPQTPELSMSVLPEHRGRGVGTRLLRCLLSAASEQAAAVSLSVSLTNPAQRLYDREGFRPVGEVQGESVTMVKQLGRCDSQ